MARGYNGESTRQLSVRRWRHPHPRERIQVLPLVLSMAEWEAGRDPTVRSRLGNVGRLGLLEVLFSRPYYKPILAVGHTLRKQLLRLYLAAMVYGCPTG